MPKHSRESEGGKAEVYRAGGERRGTRPRGLASRPCRRTICRKIVRHRERAPTANRRRNAPARGRVARRSLRAPVAPPSFRSGSFRQRGLRSGARRRGGAARVPSQRALPGPDPGDASAASPCAARRGSARGARRGRARAAARGGDVAAAFRRPRRAGGRPSRRARAVVVRRGRARSREAPTLRAGTIDGGD